MATSIAVVDNDVPNKIYALRIDAKKDSTAKSVAKLQKQKALIDYSTKGINVSRNSLISRS